MTGYWVGDWYLIRRVRAVFCCTVDRCSSVTSVSQAIYSITVGGYRLQVTILTDNKPTHKYPVLHSCIVSSWHSMWAVRVILGAPHTYLGAISKRYMTVTVTIRQFPKNTETESCPVCSSYMAVLWYCHIHSCNFPSVLQNSQPVSGTSAAGSVTLDIQNCDSEKSTLCLVRKGQCPLWQTTVWVPQLTNNQDDYEMHYVQVQIIKKERV